MLRSANITEPGEKKSIIKAGIALLGFSLALTLGACTTKSVLNVTDTPISTGKALQASQVQLAIVTAGGVLGWQIVELKPGMMQGTLQLRDHTAVVEIPYTTTNYSILFKSGGNRNEKDGQIHKNYNGWVQNLDKGITAALARQ